MHRLLILLSFCTSISVTTHAQTTAKLYKNHNDFRSGNYISEDIYSQKNFASGNKFVFYYVSDQGYRYLDTMYLAVEVNSGLYLSGFKLKALVDSNFKGEVVKLHSGGFTKVDYRSERYLIFKYYITSSLDRQTKRATRASGGKIRRKYLPQIYTGLLDLKVNKLTMIDQGAMYDLLHMHPDLWEEYSNERYPRDVESCIRYITALEERHSNNNNSSNN